MREEEEEEEAIEILCASFFGALNIKKGKRNLLCFYFNVTEERREMVKLVF